MYWFNTPARCCWSNLAAHLADDVLPSEIIALLSLFAVGCATYWSVRTQVCSTDFSRLMFHAKRAAFKQVHGWRSFSKMPLSADININNCIASASKRFFLRMSAMCYCMETCLQRFNCQFLYVLLSCLNVLISLLVQCVLPNIRSTSHCSVQ